MKNSRKYILLLILLILQIEACQNTKKTSDTEQIELDKEEYNRPNEIWPSNKNENGDYYYSVSLNSFPGYLSENAGSHFTAGKEDLQFLTMENNNWTITTGAVLNNEYHPIPNRLNVQWFSISENKFYKGIFKLPAEQLKQYFDKIWLTYGSGMANYEAAKYERFNDLIVGVTPGGGVIVWIKSMSQQVELEYFQAKETEVDWDDFAAMNNFGAGSTRYRYVKSYQPDLTFPIPFGKAEKYRSKYLWKCALEANPDMMVSGYELALFNAENQFLYREYKNGTNDLQARAVPKTISFLVQNKKKSYNFEITFNKEDIFKAFQTIFAEKNKEATLILKLDQDNDVAKIMLRGNHQEYVLNSSKVEIFSGAYKPHIHPVKEK